MRQWLKRVWIYNRFFSFCFLGAFLAVITLFFYVAVSYGKQNVYDDTYQKDAWNYAFFVKDIGRYDSAKDIPVAGFGNVFVKMFGTGYVRSSNLCESTEIYYIAEQNEEMIPLLEKGYYPSDKNMDVGPCVVIGRGYVDCIRNESGGEYIYLGDEYRCRVCGVLKPYSITRDDTRVYLYWKDMPEEVWQDLNNRYDQSIEVCSSHELDPVKCEDFERQAYGAQSQDNEYLSLLMPQSYESTNYTQVDAQYYGEISEGLARGYFKSIYLFSIALLALLCYFWSVMNKNGWVIKMVYGYSRRRILLEIYGNFMYYEVIALLIVVSLWVIGTSILGIRSEIMEGIRYWIAFFFLLFCAFPAFCSVIPGVILMKLKPALVLKTE